MDKPINKENTEIADVLGVASKPTAYSYKRVSDPNQVLKRGLGRQRDAAQEYADANNLRLDTELRLSDEGVSAFRGKNLATGQLGKFVALAEAGKLQRNSFLLVESLDRLSREHVIAAQTLFNRLLVCGLTVVTLMDKQVYSLEAVTKNPSLLFTSLGVMLRANEESETKSKRVTDSRHDRRTQASEGKRFLIYCPPWCDWIDGEYVPNKGRVAVIKRVFQMYLDGFGPTAIASRLNDDKVPAFSRGSAFKNKKEQCPEWYKQYVIRLLTDKRLIGEADVFKAKDGYFPKAISVDTFHQIQARLEQRSKPKGRVGNGFVNLFSSTLVCGKCGKCVGKNHSKRDGYSYTYLICESARSGKKSCKHRCINYDQIEKSFLMLMQYRPWFAEMMDEKGSVDNTEEVLSGALADTQKQINKWVKMMEGDEAPSKTAYAHLKALEAKAEHLTKQIAIEQGRKVDHVSGVDVGEFFAELPSKLKVMEHRLKAREVIRTMLKGIKLHTDSPQPYFQVERTNGKVWTVVLTDTRPKAFQFQIIKGRACKPSEGQIVYDTNSLKVEGIV